MGRQTETRGVILGIEDNPPPTIFQGRLELRRPWSVALLCLLTTVLLTVSFAPFNCWPLAYIALVPWAMALGGSRCAGGTLWATAAGALFWAGNLYWLWWITLWGYAGMVVYLTAYWLVAALLLKGAFRRHLPMWLVLPVVWTALEYARAHVISGFPWFFLAHSQYSRTALIQISDVLGQYGVSFFVAMVNGAIIDLVTFPLFIRPQGGGPPRLSRHVLGGLGLSAAATVALMAYGSWRLGQQTTRPGPVIGIVQQAFPITLEGRDNSSQEMLDAHLAASRAFLGAGCDLVIWPETMLPEGMNEEFLNLDEQQLTPQGQQMFEELREQTQSVVRLVEQLGCPLLAGGVSVHRNPTPLPGEGTWLLYNSALWFDGSHPWASPYYAKMHLVPFGEYVPFRQAWPALYKLLRRFVPPVMSQLDPGTNPTVFELVRKNGQWTVVTPICYEGVFARVCRKLVMQGRVKTADIVVNLSNDGWFVWRWDDGPYRGSTEQAQHLVQSCFRAVELRTPVVRAVNTGISGSIDSSGRIVALAGGGMRTMVRTTLLLDGAVGPDGRYGPGHGPKVLVDERVSLYSLVGDVFVSAVALAAVALTAGLVLSKSRTSSKDKS
jgi:apolipoprotein N-acyltransferase